MSELGTNDFEKVLFFAFKRKKEEGKDVVLGTDFAFELQERTGRSISSLSENELKALERAVSTLESQGIIRYEGGRLGGRFLKGINFEDWYMKMERDGLEIRALQVNVNAQSINAPMAIGGRDVHQQVTDTKELIRVLERLIEDPDKGKTLLRKLKESLNSEDIETIADFVNHLISLAHSLGLG